MAPGFVVVKLVGPENHEQVFLTEDHHVVQAFAPNGTDHPFSVWILPRGTTSRNDFLDSHVSPSPTEERAIDGVSVPKQKPRLRAVTRERLDDLRSRPPGRWMGRHVEVNDPASFVGEDHEAIQQAEGHPWHDEEVAGDGALKMIPEEG